MTRKFHPAALAAARRRAALQARLSLPAALREFVRETAPAAPPAPPAAPAPSRIVRTAVRWTGAEAPRAGPEPPETPPPAAPGAPRK